MKNLGIQEYLSLGYIYLFILGIITDAIFYNLLGINILNYSTISDILISPIKLLTGNIILLFTLIFILALIYVRHRSVVHKTGQPAHDQKNQLTSDKIVSTCAVMYLFLFIGLGVGRGLKLKSQIAHGKTLPDYVITFSDSNKIAAKVIGQNSAYLFYTLQNEKEIIICPISNSILQMQRLKR